MNEILFKEEVWVLMSSDRKVIAKGVPRNRYMCLVNESNKRILTYGSEGKARASSTGFYTSSGVGDYMKENGIDSRIVLEPVKVSMMLVVE